MGQSTSAGGVGLLLRATLGVSQDQQKIGTTGFQARTLNRLTAEVGRFDGVTAMLDPQTERKTIQRARRGDREAIAELIRAYQRPLEAFLFRLCGKSDLAEDISQEAFVRVIRSLDRFDERFRFSTWLFTIGKRLLVNHQQKMRPTADSDFIEYRASDSRTPATETIEIERTQQVSKMVEIAIESLVSPQREIVLLFHQQGWSVQQISTELSMPEGTVKSHLFRARRRMLDAIERTGVRNPEDVLR